MKKMAQAAEPLLTTTINSEKIIMNIWNQALAEKHTRVVSSLKAAFQRDPQLKMDLLKIFPLFSWPEFAYMPTKNTLEELKDTLEGIMELPRIQMATEAFDAIQLYISQYNSIVDQLRHSKQNNNSKPAPKNPAQQSATPAPASTPAAPAGQQQTSPKIKQLQQLLGIAPTGRWDKPSNTAFLGWLKSNGWDKYISGNKFTGKLDDAIRAMLVEKASPEPKPAETTPQQRQASRLERLKKFAILTDDEYAAQEDEAMRARWMEEAEPEPSKDIQEMIKQELAHPFVQPSITEPIVTREQLLRALEKRGPSSTRRKRLLQLLRNLD